ncbi:hypothetical protein QFW82_20785 [Streptomyces malaysiensis subsp. malaysiensis]|uniref:hypothetical protein n=1 Tax=Streptomyces malaysiensis TaxID=92644 RepID=UPI0024C0786F|nr:hypothetical protein [Streptomyces sp. NA07423]WHX19317.1 hypothetical protein QFW82_20785 [Streptomyces sp. NA07423]
MSEAIIPEAGRAETVAVMELLRAVHDALDLPLPDITERDEREHQRLLANRAADARCVLAGVVQQDHDMEVAARLLRRWTADEPVTYTPWEDKGAPA